MIIAQISDTHVALDTSDSRIRDFERTIADINALDPAPDVIIHTGDVVHNGLADEYAEAVRVMAKARAPVYAMVGNKDDRAAFRNAFADRGYLDPDSAFIDYAIKDHPVRLVVTDTKHADSNKGGFCAARARRLVEMIDAEPGKPVAVFAHHPPFMVPVGPDPLNFETAEMMEQLRGALMHSQRVVGIFSGHVHRPAAGRAGRVPAIVVPCIATPLRKGPYPPAVGSNPVYFVHRFDGAGFDTDVRVVGGGNIGGIDVIKQDVARA